MTFLQASARRVRNAVSRDERWPLLWCLLGAASLSLALWALIFALADRIAR